MHSVYSKSQLQIIACLPHHVHLLVYPMKKRMKIFKDLDTILKCPLILQQKIMWQE